MKSITFNGALPITTQQYGNPAPPSIQITETNEPGSQLLRFSLLAMSGFIAQRSSIMYDYREVAKASIDQARAFIEEWNSRPLDVGGRRLDP